MRYRLQRRIDGPDASPRPLTVFDPAYDALSSGRSLAANPPAQTQPTVPTVSGAEEPA